MNPGRVCAIVSVYRCARWIDGCLAALAESSLHAQGGLEILCLDAASPENEAAIIARWQERLPNLRYLRLDSPLGLYATWNRAAELTDCPYLAIASADDRFLPKALESMARTLDSDANAVGAYGNWVERAADRLDDARADVARRAGPFTRARLLNHFFCGSQWMWRREAHEAIGGFDDRFRIAGDHDFLLRLAGLGSMAYVDQEVGVVGRHQEALSEGIGQLQAERAQLLDRWLTRPHVSRLVAMDGVDVTADDRIAHAAAETLCATPPWRSGAPEPFLDACTQLTSLLPQSDPRRTQLQTAMEALVKGAGKALQLPLRERPVGSGDTPFLHATPEHGWQLDVPGFTQAYLGHAGRLQVDRRLSELPDQRPLFIRGAGVKGNFLANYLTRSGRAPAGFIDRLEGSTAAGLPVRDVRALEASASRPFVFLALDDRYHPEVIEEHLQQGLGLEDLLPVPFN